MKRISPSNIRCTNFLKTVPFKNFPFTTSFRNGSVLNFPVPWIFCNDFFISFIENGHKSMPVYPASFKILITNLFYLFKKKLFFYKIKPVNSRKSLQKNYKIIKVIIIIIIIIFFFFFFFAYGQRGENALRTNRTRCSEQCRTP